MSHLRLVKENYFKHMLEAWYIVINLLFALLACLIHSFIPFVFKKTASNRLIYIVERTQKRKTR